MPYLKLRPVHAHAGSMIRAEPFEILLNVDALDSVFQRVINSLIPDGTGGCERVSVCESNT